MKSVIFIEPQVGNEKPVKFTHYLGEVGWVDAGLQPLHFEKVVYLGKCKFDGDVFAAYNSGSISIYRGHLNSGKY